MTRRKQEAFFILPLVASILVGLILLGYGTVEFLAVTSSPKSEPRLVVDDSASLVSVHGSRTTASQANVRTTTSSPSSMRSVAKARAARRTASSLSRGFER